MSLQEIKNLKDQKGFTIVELLIVIVVIGILAAIVIVAYTGITRTANNNAYKQTAGQIAKVAETLNAETGAYPTGTAATLPASFNSGTNSRLPSGVTVALVTAAPTNAAATTSADASPTASYSVRLCGTAGLLIYYPVLGAANPATVSAGNTSSC